MPRGKYDRAKAGLKKDPAERSKDGTVLTERSALRCCDEGSLEYQEILRNIGYAMWYTIRGIESRTIRWGLMTAAGFIPGGPELLDQFVHAWNRGQRGRDFAEYFPVVDMTGSPALNKPRWNEEQQAWQQLNPNTDEYEFPLVAPGAIEWREPREDFHNQPLAPGTTTEQVREAWLARGGDGTPFYLWDRPVYDAHTGERIYPPPMKKRFQGVDHWVKEDVILRPRRGNWSKWIIKTGWKGLKKVPFVQTGYEFYDFVSDLLEMLERFTDSVAEQMEARPQKCRECVGEKTLKKRQNRVGMTGREWLQTRPGGLPVNKFGGWPVSAAELDYRRVKRYRRDTVLRAYEDFLRDPTPDRAEVEKKLGEGEKRYPGIVKDFWVEHRQKHA